MGSKSEGDGLRGGAGWGVLARAVLSGFLFAIAAWAVLPGNVGLLLLVGSGLAYKESVAACWSISWPYWV